MNGVDISYAIVEGDFASAKGVHNQPRCVGGRVIDLERMSVTLSERGADAGYGRMEIEPPATASCRSRPSPSTSWSAQSTNQPAQPEVPVLSAAR